MKYAIVTGGVRGSGLGMMRALIEEHVAEQVAVVNKALPPSSPVLELAFSSIACNPTFSS
ncbi:MAG: hypothetical protein ACREQN_17445 [Candidatus Binataceae bacterium]